MDIVAKAHEWLKEPPPDNGEPEPAEIASAREIILGLLNLADARRETIKSMSFFLDDVAVGLGLQKPTSPVEGAGTCFKVMQKITELRELEIKASAMHIVLSALAAKADVSSDKLTSLLREAEDGVRGETRH